MRFHHNHSKNKENIRNQKEKSKESSAIPIYKNNLETSI